MGKSIFRYFFDFWESAVISGYLRCFLCNEFGSRTQGRQSNLDDSVWTFYG